MKYTYSLIYLLLTCIFGSCTENTLLNTPPNNNPDDETLEEVSLNLESSPVRVIGETWEAKPNTRVATTTNENLISNIWVIQYNNDGTQLLTQPRYYALNPTITTTGSIKVTLRPATNSKVYIIANTNSASWTDGTDISTLTKLNNKTKTFSTENDIYGGTNNNLLMSGNLTATIAAGTDNNIGTIQMKRMVAKISFKYTLAAGTESYLKVSKITLENVPNVIKIGETTTPPYPTPLTSCPYSEVLSPQAGVIYSGYVPENLRGTTTNTDEKKKNEGAPANALVIRLYIDSEMDGSSYVYTVYPGENNYNDFNIKRNCHYNLLLKLNSTGTDSRVMAAPANCFVLRPNVSITFDPYDRSEKGGGWDYSQYVNKNENSKKISSVKILWQTGNGTDFAIGNNSNGKLVYLDNEDKIHVTAGKINGNAVIAGYNNSNEIVWSWHIWVNSNSPAQLSKAVPYTTYAWDANGVKASDPNVRVAGQPVMSCNLGALSTTPGASSYGLLYQWGRKDPFPQGKEDTHIAEYPYTSDYIVSVYNNAGTQIKMSTTEGIGELFQTIIVNSVNGNIEYTLKHPTHFFKSTDNIYDNDSFINEGDWYWGHNDKLWGGKPISEATVIYETPNLVLANNGAVDKSIFDPCPSGWMLAPGDMWLGFTKTGLNVNNNSTYDLINCSEKNATDNTNNFGYHIYMQGWKTGQTVYFPSQGLRISDGRALRNGICGNYHTSSTGRNGTVYIFHLHTPSTLLIFEEAYSNTRRTVGGPIRCVRETK